MASAAASESILFIAGLVAAGLVAATLSSVAADFSAGLRDRGEQVRSALSGRIAIVNDSAHVATAPLTLYVKNTGTETLFLGAFAVLVDGVASTDWDATVGGAPATMLAPGDLATIVVNDVAPGPGDHRVVVVSDTGDRATLEFAG